MIKKEIEVKFYEKNDYYSSREGYSGYYRKGLYIFSREQD